MIRIGPNEWLHMAVPGSGKMGRNKVSGTLYITPKRVVIQGRDGPVWSSPINGITTIQAKGKEGRMSTTAGLEVSWSSKVPVAWWGNAINFWKKGIIQDAKKVDGPPPTFSDIAELPDILANTNWRIRRYGRDELTSEGIPGDIPDTDDFRKVARDTNVILAALRHDGFPDGPPPTYYRLMLRRHALVHITKLVWGWKRAERYIISVISGHGHRPDSARMFPVFAIWPDRWIEPKPFQGVDREWYHEINPASCGGHPYEILQKCRAMLPVITRVADELHEDPTYNPYLRMRQLFESIRDNTPIPPAPREALQLARAATGNPW